jgi:hypothetical protein
MILLHSLNIGVSETGSSWKLFWQQASSPSATIIVAQMTRSLSEIVQSRTWS